MKPIEFDRFLQAVQKADNRVDQIKIFKAQQIKPKLRPLEFIFIKSGIKCYKVKLSDILYIESANNYVNYVLANQKILSLDSLSNVVTILPTQQFIRVHKSYLIALAHIDVLQKEFITIGNQRIPIGRTFRAAFFERIDQFNKSV